MAGTEADTGKLTQKQVAAQIASLEAEEGSQAQPVKAERPPELRGSRPGEVRKMQPVVRDVVIHREGEKDTEPRVETKWDQEPIPLPPTAKVISDVPAGIQRHGLVASLPDPKGGGIIWRCQCGEAWQRKDPKEGEHEYIRHLQMYDPEVPGYVGVA